MVNPKVNKPLALLLVAVMCLNLFPLYSIAVFAESIEDSGSPDGETTTVESNENDTTDSPVFVLPTQDEAEEGEGANGKLYVGSTDLAVGTYSIFVKATDVAENQTPDAKEINITVEDGPTVSSVLLASPRSYYVSGDNLEFYVNFDKAVDVIGIPELSFELKGSNSTENNTRNAVYTGGSGTSSLKFSYTVAVGDLAREGIVINGLTGNIV